MLDFFFLFFFFFFFLSKSSTFSPLLKKVTACCMASKLCPNQSVSPCLLQHNIAKEARVCCSENQSGIRNWACCLKKNRNKILPIHFVIISTGPWTRYNNSTNDSVKFVGAQVKSLRCFGNIMCFLAILQLCGILLGNFLSILAVCRWFFSKCIPANYKFTVHTSTVQSL